MGFFDKFRGQNRNHGNDGSDGFKPTTQETMIINAYLPEGRGGFKGLCEALGWAGVIPERQKDLIEHYRSEKHKEMGRETISLGKER